MTGMEKLLTALAVWVMVLLLAALAEAVYQAPARPLIIGGER